MTEDWPDATGKHAQNESPRTPRRTLSSGFTRLFGERQKECPKLIAIKPTIARPDDLVAGVNVSGRYKGSRSVGTDQLVQIVQNTSMPEERVLFGKGRVAPAAILSYP